MILGTALLIKILLPAAICIFVWRMFRAPLSAKSRVGLVLLCVLFAGIANHVSNLVPPLTDTITLTAMGETGQSGLGQEVYVHGFTVDEEVFAPQNAAEGKWAWYGNDYGWRPETDDRQPEGTTRTVTLEVPVGWERTVNFSVNDWRGWVEVTGTQSSEKVDTSVTTTAVLGRSDTKLLVFNQIIQLAVFAALLLLLCSAEILVTRWAIRDRSLSVQWFNKNSARLICAGIAVIAFFWMVSRAGDFSFWYDEMFQLCVSRNGVGEVIKANLAFSEVTPPLYGVCAALWYDIAPYGEQWLLLLSIVPTAISIYWIGVTCELVSGPYGAISASLLMALSTVTWSGFAIEFRAYSFVLLFSVAALYFYVKRSKEEKRTKWNWCFSVSLAALAMSHYFGMIACAVYFLADLFLLYKKQVRVRDGFYYALPGGLSLLWLGMVVMSIYEEVSDFSGWWPVPTAANIKAVLSYIAGSGTFRYVLLLIGLVAGCMSLLNLLKREFTWTYFYRAFCFAMILIPIVGMFFYGNVINTKTTLWVERYFAICIPCAYLLLSEAFVGAIDCFKAKNKTIAGRFACVFIAALLFLDFSPGKVYQEPYRAAADWLYADENYIYNDSTLVISCRSKKLVDAWDEYYVTKQGKRDPVNLISQYDAQILDYVAQSDRIYFTYMHSGQMSSELKSVIKSDFELLENNTGANILVYARKPQIEETT